MLSHSLDEMECLRYNEDVFSISDFQTMIDDKTKYYQIKKNILF